MRRILFAVTVLVPSLAAAQAGRVEITPTVGITRGGEIVVVDQAFQNRQVNVNLANNGSFGLRLGVALSRRLELELLADRQNGQLKDNKGLFGETPGGFVPIMSSSVLDFDVTYYHLGLLWHFTPGPNGWYAVVSGGQTKIEPGSPLPSATRASWSAGLGVKVELNEFSSLRFEGRYFRTDTSDLPSAVQHFNTTTYPGKDCYDGGPCTYTYRYADTLEQVQLSVGYVIRF